MDCCTDVDGCAWEYHEGHGQYECMNSLNGGSKTVQCLDYIDNRVACEIFGCEWKPANSGVCTGEINGRIYGEGCTVNADCAKCLVCDSGKCTQRAGVCTLIPGEYVAPPPTTSGPGAGLTPMSAIENLEQGTGIGEGGAVVPGGSGFYKVGWFSDWEAMGLIGIATVCAIIALAAMLGTAFNLPEVKAFANTEMRQAVISALLIVSLVAIVTFLNTLAVGAIDAAGLPVPCTGDEPCYVIAAKYYLTTLYDTADLFAQSELKESITIMKRASRGYSVNFNMIQALYAGTNIRINAGQSLVGEQHQAMFSQASKMMSSIYAQKYMIDVISFGIAPLLLLLGILFRTFFFTRKLGGLLLAIAISLFIIYPLTFAFAWYTLNVTVYGERTLEVQDPYCPSECTGTYPVAFFVDPGTDEKAGGELMQFPTTQSVLRAGITKVNWAAGGPDIDGDGLNDFPGLVACEDLTSIGIAPTDIPNSCSGCPDYCREVPAPSSMPGCNTAECSNCNPGCKIVRQRLSCETDSECSGKCPEKCRTMVPVENKCFLDEKGGIIKANLSAVCSGCSKYPDWCRYLKLDASGGYLPFYDDPLCTDPGNSAVNVANDPACTANCSYITRYASDTSCDSLCSVTTNGITTMCPDICRVTNIYNTPIPNAWMTAYDVPLPDNTKFATQCINNLAVKNACLKCNTEYPECMSTAPDSPESGSVCAPYPRIGSPPGENCTSCPEYCRRIPESFATLFTTFDWSSVERDATQLPDVCSAEVVGLACGDSSCSTECDVRINTPNRLCRAFVEAPGADKSFCRACPEAARLVVGYPAPQGGSTSVDNVRVDSSKNYSCFGSLTTGDCSFICKQDITIPNTVDNPLCVSSDGVTGCPYGCRIHGLEQYMNASCSSAACQALDAAGCFVTVDGNPKGLACNEFIGNGPVACHSISCLSYSAPDMCGAASCTWNPALNICDDTACSSKTTQALCEPVLGCEWTSTYDKVKIDDRAGEYAKRSACRQCPEQCRLETPVAGSNPIIYTSYEGNCGVENNGDKQYVDCSEEACPSSCRAWMPVPKLPSNLPDFLLCQSFANPLPSGSCLDCPALCRRSSEALLNFDKCPAEHCMLDPLVCSDACRMPDAPTAVCEGCFDCDLDCNYYPAIRTDCSEICSDEALAGPVDIAADDFIKRMPGAKTSYPNVRNIGVLFIPAVLLPLFCIVIVISFVRVLSPVLGGDIDIPGIGRLI